MQLKEEQLSLFDMPCGKMSQEHCQLPQVTVEKELLSNASLLNSLGLRKNKLPLFLSLKTDGQMQDASYLPMELQALPGELSICNFTAAPKDGVALLFSATTMDYLPQESCLSNILEQNTDPKYRLSAKACAGILARAEKRGKNLPEPLRKALMDTVEGHAY